MKQEKKNKEYLFVERRESDTYDKDAFEAFMYEHSILRQPFVQEIKKILDSLHPHKRKEVTVSLDMYYKCLEMLETDLPLINARFQAQQGIKYFFDYWIDKFEMFFYGERIKVEGWLLRSFKIPVGGSTKRDENTLSEQDKAKT